MNRILKILTLVGSLWAAPALAADNAIVLTPGSGVTMRSVDVGAGVQAPGHALVNASGTQIGVSGSPLFIQGAASAFASGSFLSGAFASGSYASGAFASGSMVDLLTMRGTVGAGTAASNSLLTGCIYNSTPITLTNGQGSAVQCSANGYPTVVVSNTNANGQAAAASSSPVVIAKNSGTGSTVAGAAVGTAGSASAEVVTVQGVASMTPVQVSQATASNLNAAVVGTGTAGSAAGGVLTVQGVASMTPFLSNPGTAANWGIGATAAAVPANAMYNGFNSGGNLVGVAAATPMPVRTGDGTRQATLDACEANAQQYTTGVITTATTTRIIAPSASNKNYICSFFLTASATDNVAVVEGTGGTCVTGLTGVIGGSTTTNGLNFVANGGVMMQAGGKTAVAQTAGTNVDTCLITSTTGPLVYAVKYVQAP